MNTSSVNHATLARWQQELRDLAGNTNLVGVVASQRLLKVADEMDTAMFAHTTLDSVFVALKGAQATLQEIHDLAKQVSPRDERGAWIAAKASNLFQIMDHWAVLWRGAR